MAEHRVMSEDLLGITHYRSKRYNESQQFGRSLSGVFPWVATILTLPSTGCRT